MSKLEISKPVFLLGSHKSGTSLVRSLLDEHPELVVFPSEIHFFQYSGYWVDYSLRKQRPKAFSVVDRKNLLKRFLDEENQCTDPYGASDMAGKYDEGTFNAVINGYEPESLRDLFELYVEAIYESYSRKPYPVNKRLVEKSVENVEFAPLLRRLYPDCKFIHIVRNPYATLVSIRRSRSDLGYPYLGRIAMSLRNSYYNLLKNQDILDNYLVVKYEDLVSFPQESITHISDFLGIASDPLMLTPTLLGQPWGGNSSADGTFKGISASRIESWTQEISDFEIVLANQALGPVIRHFSYEPLTPKHSVFRQRFQPHLGERPETYIRNRLFRWLMKSI